MSYAKLFSSITESSLWSEPPEIRVLFVSMLARADATGFVEAALPGLARLANLPEDKVIHAIEVLSSPDKNSKNKTNEGRRVIEVPGGWAILNYEEYRNRRDEEARREYMRNYIAEYRKSGKDKARNPVNAGKRSVNNVNRGKPGLAQAEAEAEAEAEEKNSLSGLPDHVEVLTKARILIHYLNERTGRHYRETAGNLGIISARLNEAGVDVEGVKSMIDRQCDRWKGNEQEEYLRPSTLFRPSNFDAYYAAKDVPIPKPLVNGHKSMLDTEIDKINRETAKLQSHTTPIKSNENSRSFMQNLRKEIES